MIFWGWNGHLLNRVIYFCKLVRNKKLCTCKRGVNNYPMKTNLVTTAQSIINKTSWVKICLKCDYWAKSFFKCHQIFKLPNRWNQRFAFRKKAKIAGLILTASVSRPSNISSHTMKYKTIMYDSISSTQRMENIEQFFITYFFCGNGKKEACDDSFTMGF